MDSMQEILSYFFKIKKKMSSNDFLTYFFLQNSQPNNLSSNFSLDKIVALITNTNSSDNSS